MLRLEALFLILLVAIGNPQLVRADVGLDFLAIKKDSGWDCDAMLAPIKRLKQTISIGWLDDSTFGTNTACLERLLASGQVSKARAHLLNNTCVRNNKCWAGDRLNGYTLARLEAEALTPGSPLLELVCKSAQVIAEYAKRFPQIRFRVSGLLEHNLSRDAAIAVAARVRSCAPGTDVVDNPLTNLLTSYSAIPDSIRESHGPTVGPITSLDGVSVERVNVEAWKSENANSDMTLIWASSYNCRVNGPWEQPNQRKHCPTADLFALYTQLLLPESPVPKSLPPQCKTAETLAAPWSYYSAMGNDGSGDLRVNKPGVKTPATAERLELLSAKGDPLAWMRHVNTLPRAGQISQIYSLGLGSGQSAVQLGQAAELKGGSEWVLLHVGSNCVWANAYRSAPVINENPMSLQQSLRQVSGDM